MNFPKSIFFIISNEFCERFSYYGLRAILALYLKESLGYSEQSATLIFHTSLMLCYFSPLLGGIMADSWLGKYKTILYVSILYAFGDLILSLSSISILPIPHASLCIIGILVIAIGSGGIKPCVSSFGGDQFVLPQQAAQLELYFAIFYFTVNCGGLVSSFITPIIRENVHCFGLDNCYPLAFGVPSLLMFISFGLFVCGKPLYIIKKPSGNIVVGVFQCVTHALLRKMQTQKIEKKNHWLDYASPKFSKSLIEDTKVLFRLLFIFIPIIFYWLIYDLSASKWVFQAANMDGNIHGWFTIQPDQFGTLNPLLILIFIPLFRNIIYPVLHYFHLLRKPLQKIYFGGLLAAFSFIIAGFVQIKIEKDNAILPNVGEAQLRLYNSLNSSIQLVSSDVNINATLGPMNTVEFLNLSVESKKIFQINAILDDSLNPANYSTNVQITNHQISSYLFTSPFSVQPLNLAGYDEAEKSMRESSKLKIIYGENESLDVQLKGPTNLEIHVKNYQSEVVHVRERGKFTVFVKGRQLNASIDLLPAGFYTYLISGRAENMNGKLFTITKPNTVNMLWQVPQSICLSAAEILLAVTGLEYCFTNSPESMKSLISSLWLLTESLANVAIVILNSFQIVESKANEYFFYAGIASAVMIIFILHDFFYGFVPKNRETDDRTPLA